MRTSWVWHGKRKTRRLLRNGSTITADDVVLRSATAAAANALRARIAESPVDLTPGEATLLGEMLARLAQPPA